MGLDMPCWETRELLIDWGGGSTYPHTKKKKETGEWIDPSWSKVSHVKERCRTGLVTHVDVFVHQTTLSGDAID
jgi:hypothetical protein